MRIKGAWNMIRTSLVSILLAAWAPQGGPATVGKALFEDDFSRAELAPKWKVGKGSFEVKDGIVTVSENPDDHHGAYAYVKPSFQFKDIVVEYSAKLAGTR